MYKWIRCGVAAVVPLNYLNLFTGDQLEIKVCGEADIDIDKLQSKIELEEWGKKD